jgi:hypothetical protein
MRYSQLFIVFMAILWVFLPLSQNSRFVFLGIIAIYLALHNYVGYNWSRQGKIVLRKYKQLTKKMGEKYGPAVYLILFVFLPLALGLYVFITGLMLNAM